VAHAQETTVGIAETNTTPARGSWRHGRCGRSPRRV